MPVSCLLCLTSYAGGWRALVCFQRGILKVLPVLFLLHVLKDHLPEDLIQQFLKHSEVHSPEIQGPLPDPPRSWTWVVIIWVSKIMNLTCSWSLQPRLPLILMISSVSVSTRPLDGLSRKSSSTGFRSLLDCFQLTMLFSQMRSWEHDAFCSWSKKTLSTGSPLSDVEPKHQISFIILIPNFNSQSLNLVMAVSQKQLFPIYLFLNIEGISPPLFHWLFLLKSLWPSIIVFLFCGSPQHIFVISVRS